MLGLELFHVLKAVVDEAEPRALAATVVGSEAEEGHRRRVRHTELLLREKREKVDRRGVVPGMGKNRGETKKERGNRQVRPRGTEGG